MRLLPVIFKHQLTSYASTPATYLSIALFLLMSVTLGLYAHRWLEQDTLDLQIFFQLHPWLYLVLMPTLTTQLWAEESNAGFLDVVKILPITASELAIGKFLAAWAVASAALISTFPLVIVANYLGTADNGLIASQFIASWLLAGSYLAVGCFICSFTRQHIIIFILTLCLLLIASGLSTAIDNLEHQAPVWLIDSLTVLNPLSRFSTIDNGKLTLHDAAYFISIIVAFLTATTVILNHKHR
ncbi:MULTISPECIES: ABC transporter permease [Pseudomonas]|uniref:ABC transporter permease n=1 Tax=Pseudomonas fluorescens TaxID=294 RepID=A0A4Y9TBX6_PSEFL|nr:MULTISPECIES: ABC transporter permease [Pseudomonas]MCX9151256.1 ABC transporter permease [Pseudomonas sp. TB1-B1]TFW41611.1 ABC transporter permease [Pseudomonas fluorescens]TKJ58185.1 ABC transporter permease [Pseudomonas sp. CFBP13506]CRM01682.1 gliding motility-associated ABC transporter permease protein GldF [Pseudomonas sp. 31 E 5]CRM07264.1 gliding motility-associated ABC transporter permease protein GldF [Pseudomonas sp. 31 E 6]